MFKRLTLFFTGGNSLKKIVYLVFKPRTAFLKSIHFYIHQYCPIVIIMAEMAIMAKMTIITILDIIAIMAIIAIITTMNIIARYGCL